MDADVFKRIDDYLDEVFSQHEDSPTVAELRIEVRHDLLERLGDLIEQGIAEEVAYAQVISMVGDLEPTIEEFAEKDRLYEEGGTQLDPGQEEFQAPSFGGFTGSTPGETYSEHKDQASATSGDWGSLGDAFAEGLDSVISQVSTAITKVEEALSDTGFAGIFIGGDTFKDRTTDWQKRWEAAKTGQTFAASTIRGGDFKGKDLQGSTFVATTLIDADFSGTDLSSSSFKASDMRGAKFNRSNLSGANLATCSIRNSEFHHTNLTQAVLSYSDTRKSHFVAATMTGLRARYADFRGVHFSDCLMDRADFTGTDLRKSSFDGLMLNGVNFSMANLSEASFRGTTLREVSFHHVPRKVISAIIFSDTTMDQASYDSLRASGATPTGITVTEV